MAWRWRTWSPTTWPGRGRLARRDVVAVIASPLQRAQETAGPIAAAFGLEIRTDERIIEAGNHFEGKTFGVGDGSLRHPEHWPYLRNPFRPSWGEPYKEQVDRMLAAVETARELARGHEAVLVSHQLPVWVTRLALENRHLWHDPRKRQCSRRVADQPALRGRHPRRRRLQRARRGRCCPVRRRSRGPDVRRSRPARRRRRWPSCCSPAARPTARRRRPTTSSGQGYQSGDGSTTTWAAGDRSGPLELSGTDFAGTAQDVADWRGDVVVLNTWYANCPPCRAEAPDLAALSTDYAADGVQRARHQPDRRRRHRAGLRAPVRGPVPEPRGHRRRRDRRPAGHGPGATPCRRPSCSTATGKVAGRILGLADPSTLRSMVDELLAETPTPS